jgi:hypothetical protein
MYPDHENRNSGASGSALTADGVPERVDATLAVLKGAVP